MLKRIFKRKKQAQPKKPKREIPWPVRTNVRLLVLQAVGALYLALYTAPAPPIPNHRFDELWMSALFLLFAFLAVYAALGLLRLRPLAWDIAMLVEGSALLLALVLYIGDRPFFVYPILLLCIIAVLNLNQAEFRRAFPTDIPQTTITDSNEL